MKIYKDALGFAKVEDKNGLEYHISTTLHDEIKELNQQIKKLKELPIVITQYKKIRHKLYTYVAVLTASGKHKVIYKDVDNNSRPYFETNDGYKTPHKYLMIYWLNKH